MQENNFTGYANKVQGKAAATPGNAEKHSDFKRSRKVIIQDPLTLRAASCTMGVVRALSSAVRAFGLHPKGRPFKSDSAHHPCVIPFSGDVVQLVRTLPCHQNLQKPLQYLHL